LLRLEWFLEDLWIVEVDEYVMDFLVGCREGWRDRLVKCRVRRVVSR
jgi:hypothetical protein